MTTPDKEELEAIITKSNGKPSTHARNVMIGGFYIILSCICFSSDDATTKYGQNEFGISESQMLFGRYGIHMIISFFLWFFCVNIDNNTCTNDNNHWYGNTQLWILGTAFAMHEVFDYYSVITLPIGDQNCLWNLNVIWTSLFAFLFLNEQLPKLTILIPTILLTLSGSIILCQPTFLFKNDSKTLNTPGILCAIISSICWSINCVLIRINNNMHWLQIQIVGSIVCEFIGVPAMMLTNYYLIDSNKIGFLLEWKWDLLSILWPFLLGILSFLAVSTSSIGYQKADATQVSWLELFILFCSFIYQSTLFNDIPNQFEIIGAIMIVIGCSLPLFTHVHQYCLQTYHSPYSQIK